MDLVEVRYVDVDWIGLAQDRDKWRALVNSVLNFRLA
jgi:predicted small integral membrane protein